MPRKAGVAFTHPDTGRGVATGRPRHPLGPCARGANCQHHGAAPAITHYCTPLSYPTLPCLTTSSADFPRPADIPR